MTVVRANTAEYTASPRCPHPFGIPGQREGFAVPASPQTRTWTRDARSGRGKRRSVIAEKTQPLPMFSAEGIRWDVLIVALTLVLALFLAILAADVDALFAHGGRIGELNAGIASLETNNSSLREALSGAHSLAGSYKISKAEDGESERIVVLSPAPVE